MLIFIKNKTKEKNLFFAGLFLYIHNREHVKKSINIIAEATKDYDYKETKDFLDTYNYKKDNNGEFVLDENGEKIDIGRNMPKYSNKVEETLSLIEEKNILSAEKAENMLYLISKIRKPLLKTLEKASFDIKTDLYNFGTYSEVLLPNAINRSERDKSPLSYLMIDIDYFKKFNDTYGHQFGDVVLKKVAHCIKDNCRKTDLACRFGGEEMSVILPKTDLNGAVEIAEKIKTSISEMSFQAPNGKETGVKVSIGVSQLNKEDENGNQMVKEADEAVYKAKEDGRNQVVKYHEGITKKTENESNEIANEQTKETLTETLIENKELYNKIKSILPKDPKEREIMLKTLLKLGA